MPGHPFLAPVALVWLAAFAAPAMADPLPGADAPPAAAPAQPTRKPTDIAGTWVVSLDRSRATCRVMLRAEKSDKGNYFLGMPAACRHAMPAIEKVGRWTLPDDGHLTLDDPAGQHVLVFVSAGDGFSAQAAGGTYRMSRADAAGRSTPVSVLSADTGDAAADMFEPVTPPPLRATVQPIVSKREVAAVAIRPADLAGRYAVMREKHDTGCMLTLDDQAKGKAGGERAQLAPGCRDQGIVIFDPVGWRLVNGALVLTARAGHTTKLGKTDEGNWAKDTKDGSKPIGLKKL